jgi:predicted enzyme related to lactoylglutathione lyase
MPTKTKHDHGTFSYVELGTTDAASAKKFYGGLFGWTFDDTPAGPDMTYTICKLGTETACALYKMGKEMQGVPPHWLSYVTVDDVDAITKKAVSNGGKAMKEPFDVMDYGRMSVLTDPTGATLALWQPKTHIGSTVMMEPGALCYNELYTTNVDAAGKFYVQTLGWKTESMDMGAMGTYTLFKRDGATSNVGGMMAMPPNMKGVPSNWLAYFLVTDCDASAKKAGELGGKVMMPPMDIPKIGRFAVIQDPQGAVFAIFKNAH